MHAAFSFQILQILLQFQVFGDKRLTRLITLTFFPSSVPTAYLQTGFIKTTINSGHAVSWISLNNICLICCIYIYRYIYTCLISE